MIIVAVKLLSILMNFIGVRLSCKWVVLTIMYRSIRNFIIPPPPPGIPREFDFKSSPGSREFDVLGLPCGGAFDNGVGNLNRKS